MTITITLWRFYIGEEADRMPGKVSGEWSALPPSAHSSDWLEPYSIAAPSSFLSFSGIINDWDHPECFGESWWVIVLPSVAPPIHWHPDASPIIPSPIQSFITPSHRLCRTSFDYRTHCCILGHCHPLVACPSLVCIFAFLYNEAVLFSTPCYTDVHTL